MLGQPGLGRRERLDLAGAGAVRVRGRQRPRQGGPVDLAGGAGGQVVDDREERHQGGRQLFAQASQGEIVIEGLGVGGQWRGRHDVPHEDLISALGPLNRAGAAGDPGQRLERRVDLAQLDAATAQLDLLVGATEEEEALGIGAHEVTAAVGAVPPECRQRAVFLRVLVLVEVAGDADAGDHEFAGAAHRHGQAGGVDDGQLPAVQRQADAHRFVAA